MEEQANSIQQLQPQYDNNINKLKLFLQNQNYESYFNELSAIKTRIEQQFRLISKDFAKGISQEINKFMEKCMNEANNTNVKMTKAIGLDILSLFFKMSFSQDQDIQEIIIKTLIKLYENDTEEFGIRAIKIMIDIIKQSKNNITEVIYGEIVPILINLFNNIKSMTSLNKPVNTDEKKNSILSTITYKYINEGISLAFVAIQARPNSSNMGEKTKTMLDSLQYIVMNPITVTITSYSSPEHRIYEHYLATLTKGINLFLYIKKQCLEQDTKLFKGIIKTIKFIIQQTTQPETKREIISIAIAYSKESYGNDMFEERFFFINESTYLKQELLYTDTVLSDVWNNIMLFNDEFRNRYSLKDKCKYFEELISKLNDFHLTLEVKKNVFDNLLTMFEDIQNSCIIDASVDLLNNKLILFDLSTLLIKQLALFFEFLSKMLGKLDSIFLKEDKKYKFEYLDKNMFETVSEKIDLDKVNSSNLKHRLGLFVNNEYEKYTYSDDSSTFREIFAVTIKIVSCMSKNISHELNMQVNDSLFINSFPQVNEQGKSSPESMIIHNKLYEKTKHLAKLFNVFFITNELMHKQHKHSQTENYNMHNGAQLLDVYLALPESVCVLIFKKLMPSIKKLMMQNYKVCQNRNCVIYILIIRLFDVKQVDSLYNLKKQIFDIYYDYFISQLYYIGNSFEEYNINNPETTTYMTFYINILKDLLKFIRNYATESLYKYKLVLVINCLILSKKSQYLGNYIYIIRSLFKSFALNQNQQLSLSNKDTENNFRFYSEGLIKYLVLFKEEYVFFKEIILELLIIYPMKFTIMIEYANVIFPALLESLNMSPEIIIQSFNTIEQYINILSTRAETVKPVFDSYINQLTNKIISIMYLSHNINQQAIKLLGKLGGKSRIYDQDKTINFRTNPYNVLVFEFKNENSNEVLDFPMDHIIEICTKNMTKKNNNNTYQITLIILKASMLSFIKKKIDYEFIMKVKEDIIDSIAPNNQQFESNTFFKILSNSEQIKINPIYRKSAVLLMEKILRNLCICYGITELEQDVKEFIQFLCDYFVMAMVSKDKNNKHIHIFEIDPMIILDVICEFLFPNLPTIIKNHYQTFTSLSKKIITLIIDTIYRFFDYNENVIQHLEIIDILYMKVLNYCYINDVTKQNSGLIILIIYIKKFSSAITFKYSKWILRAVFLVASNYPSLTKNKLENECKEIIKKLADIFLQEDKEYDNLTVDILNSTMDLEDNIQKTKEKFRQMYYVLRFLVNEIIDNSNSNVLYQITICNYAIQRILMNQRLKIHSSMIFLINHIKINDFLIIYQQTHPKLTIEQQFMSHLTQYPNQPLNDSNKMDIDNQSSFSLLHNDKAIIPIENNTIDWTHKITQYQTKSLLESKISSIMTTLTYRMKLTEMGFTPMISNTLGLITFYKHCHSNLIQFILKDISTTQENYDLLYNMLVTIYSAIVSDLFFFHNISKQHFNDKFHPAIKHAFLENIYHSYTKRDSVFTFQSTNTNNKQIFTNEIPLTMIEEVADYIQKEPLKRDYETNVYSSYSYEMFPVLSNKVKLIKTYIKFLGLIFSDMILEDNILQTKNKDNYCTLKNKICLIILSSVLQRDELDILKQSKKCLQKIFSKDQNLKERISQDEIIMNYMHMPIKENDKITIKKCSPNLFIMFKVLSIPSIIIYKIKRDLNALKIESEINNGSIIEIYSFLGLLSYVKYESLTPFATDIFNLLIGNERNILMKKFNIDFTKTEYKNKIIKLLTKLRKEFCLFFMNNIKNQPMNWYELDLYKNIIKDSKSYLIREIFIKELIMTIQNSLQSKNIVLNQLNINLKFVVMICKKSSLCLLANPFFLDNLINYINLPSDQFQLTLCSNKGEKYLIKLIQIYLQTFNKKNYYIFDLFNLINRSESYTYKNEGQLFALIKLHFLPKINKIENILEEFYYLYSRIIQFNCLPLIIKYLIIPLLVKYVKKKKANKLFLLSILKKYASIMSSKFTDEHITIEKWKLICLIITILIEVFQYKYKKPNQYVDELNQIFDILMKILSQPHNSSILTNSQMFCTLSFILVSKLNDYHIEKYIDNMNTLIKYGNDDYYNISYAIAEITYPHENENKIFYNTLSFFMKDRFVQAQLFQLFGLIIKYPDYYNPQSSQVFFSSINYVYKMSSSFAICTSQYKKLILQLIGYNIYYINLENIRKKELKEQSDGKNESFIWKTLQRLYKGSCIQNPDDNDSIDIMNRLLTYMREFLSMTSLSYMMSFDSDIIKNTAFIHSYVYLFKLFVFFGKKELLYTQIEGIFSLLKNITRFSHHRIINDLAFIIRILINNDLLNQLNEAKTIYPEKMKEFKIIIYLNIKKTIEDFSQIHNKKKGKIFDNDEKILSADISSLGPIIFNSIKEKGDNINNRMIYNFPHVDFKMYIIYNQYLQSINKTDSNLSSTIKESIDVLMKINETLLYYFFDNWYCYTLFAIELMNPNINTKLQTVSWININAYLKSNHSFYFNLKEVDDLKQCRNEPIESIIHKISEPKSLSQNLKEFDYMNMLETLFCGFHLFFNSKQIMTTKGMNVNVLFIKIIQRFRNLNIVNQPILEHLFYIALSSPYQINSNHNKLLYNVLKEHNFNYNRMSNIKVFIIALEYIEHYITNSNHSKSELYITLSFKLLISSSRLVNEELRSRVFNLFTKLYGNKLIDILKWIFTCTDNNEGDDIIFWLPFSVELLLHHFKGNHDICIKDRFIPKLTQLFPNKEDAIDDDNTEENNHDNQDDNKMQIDSNSEENKLDPDNCIKILVSNYNLYIKSIKTKTLLTNISQIIPLESNISQRIWTTLFPHIWKILSKQDQETLTIYIDEYLKTIAKHKRDYQILNIVLESFGNCVPPIKISPEIMLSLVTVHRTWMNSYFYLENLLINNIEKERNYHCLVKLLDLIKEDQHKYGLQYYMTDNAFTLGIISNMECLNNYKVEELLSYAFKEYKEFIDQMPTTELETINEFGYKIDFSVWQSSLIDCYKKTNRFPEIVSLSDEFNNIDIKIEGLWYSGSEKWVELDSMKMASGNHYLLQINDIYMLMMKKANSFNDTNNSQEKCINFIKQMSQEFSHFPSNYENLEFAYNYIFQLAIEAWESSNTFNEMDKSIKQDKAIHFNENLMIWRDRIIDTCEDYHSLKSIIEPRNYLYEFLQRLAKDQCKKDNESIIKSSYCSEKLWNNLMFIRYTRKLGLYELFFEYIDLFNEKIKEKENLSISIYYSKNIEELKFIRKVTENYDLGIELIDKYLFEHDTLIEQGLDQEKEMRACYNAHKAYFFYKKGNVVDAHELFKKSISIYPTDYHVYQDWAEMSENVTILIKGNEQHETTWFENTMVNYFMSIIYKLDKAKYIIPKLFSLMKMFPHQDLTQKYNNHLQNTPSWIWIFWLPTIFEDIRLSNNHSRIQFYSKIFEEMARENPQSLYYPLTISMQLGIPHINQLCEPLLRLLKDNDKKDQIFGKIELMIKEIEGKVEKNKDEILLGQLNILMEIQMSINIKECMNRLNAYVNFLKKSNTSGYTLINTIVEDLSATLQTKGLTIFALFDKLKHYRYYLHSKLLTENNFEEIKHVLDDKLYNGDFKGIEIPGFYSNQIIEPVKENKIFITRFESNYDHKFLSLVNQKLLIRGTNDKTYYFTITKEKIAVKPDIKILQLQTLLNHIFLKHKDTYQLKIFFNMKIVYFIKNNLKISQEEVNQYYFNEIFEFCTQKNGYDPEIAYALYEEEVKASNNQIVSNYFIPDILEKVFLRMNNIIPKNSLKGFIHKFVVTSEEIFMFRKQFAISYAINSLFSYLLSDLVILNKISLNKEKGACIFHDLQLRLPDDNEMKSAIEIRLSKNISYFLSPACLYGVIPSVMHAATRAIFHNKNHFEKILMNTIFTSNKNAPLSTDSCMNMSLKFMKKVNYLRNIEHDDTNGNDPLKMIMCLINNAMNDDNLKKMFLYWDPWF